MKKWNHVCWHRCILMLLVLSDLSLIFYSLFCSLRSTTSCTFSNCCSKSLTISLKHPALSLALTTQLPVVHFIVITLAHLPSSSKSLCAFTFSPSTSLILRNNYATLNPFAKYKQSIKLIVISTKYKFMHDIFFWLLKAILNLSHFIYFSLFNNILFYFQAHFANVNLIDFHNNPMNYFQHFKRSKNV